MYLVFTRMSGESYLLGEDVPLVEFMYLVFTRMPGGGDSSVVRAPDS